MIDSWLLRKKSMCNPQMSSMLAVSDGNCVRLKGRKIVSVNNIGN